MENLTEFYTDTDNALLELIDYHKHIIREAEKSGNADPDDKERLVLFDGFVDLVHNRAMQRKERHESEMQENINFMQGRLIADCEQCGGLRPVAIVGEEIHDTLGFICDVVVCSECGSEFLNPLPNNWDDRLKYYDHFIQVLLTVNDNGTTIAESIHQPEAIAAMLEQFKKFKEAHLEEVRSKRELEMNEEKAEESLKVIYDYLLIAKLNQSNYNTPPAIS
jgi:hypothetical protein